MTTDDDHRDAVIALCQDLVRLTSLSGAERAVADHLLATLPALGYEEVVRDELGSVVALRHGAGPGPTVVFDAHLDTVPVTEPERWSQPPLGGVLTGGLLYGRGACDVKGSLAAMCLGLLDPRREELRGTLIAAATVGEEQMEGAALRRVLDRFGGDRVVICEPTSLRLGLGHKGRASLCLEAEGRAAHTSRPENGVNAVYRLVEAIPGLRRLVLPQDELLGQGVMELVEVASEPYPGSSMVPYRAVARFDRRLVRGETRESVLAETSQAVAGLAGVRIRLHHTSLACYTGVTVEEEVFHPPWTLDAESPVARAARQALRAVDQSGEIFYAPFCTNGAHSAGERGLPTLIYGAGDVARAHAIDENVPVKELLGARRGYAGLARALCRG